jgi:glycerol uptake facilitator-like aquaporin
MGATPTPDLPHPVDLRRAALVGAVLAAILCLVFWATAAAQTLPAGSPAWARTFQPAAGIERLAAGLFWTGLAGAVLSALLAAAVNRARRAGHRQDAH